MKAKVGVVYRCEKCGARRERYAGKNGIEAHVDEEHRGGRISIVAAVAPRTERRG